MTCPLWTFPAQVSPAQSKAVRRAIGKPQAWHHPTRIVIQDSSKKEDKLKAQEAQNYNLYLKLS